MNKLAYNMTANMTKRLMDSVRTPRQDRRVLMLSDMVSLKRS